VCNDQAVVWGGEWGHPGIHVLDGVNVPQAEGVDFWVVGPHWPMVSMAYFQGCRGYEISDPYPYPYPQILRGYPWIYPYP